MLAFQLIEKSNQLKFKENTDVFNMDFLVRTKNVWPNSLHASVLSLLKVETKAAI